MTDEKQMNEIVKCPNYIDWILLTDKNKLDSGLGD